MRIMPVLSSSYAQKNQQTNFKSKFVANDVLEKTFNHAEKQACRNFLAATKHLLNDGIHRTLELTSGIYVSKDGVLYTKTALNDGEKQKEFAGFPHIYDTTVDETMANDGRLLLIDYAKNYSYPDYRAMSKEEIQQGIRDIKKQIFNK